MLDRVGHPVIRLMRVRINGLEMGELSSGAFRPLTQEELRKIGKELHLWEAA
jgi:23S rRNA pseudouridine2605 synthase